MFYYCIHDKNTKASIFTTMKRLSSIASITFLKAFKAFTLNALISVFFSSALIADTILVYGDSLSAGYGLKSGQEWPTLLSQKLAGTPFKHYTVINSSISGETTSGGLARLNQTLDKYQPSIVILELGANDGLRGQSLKQMQINLSKMIEQCHAHQSEVILVGMFIPPNYGKRYTQAFHQSFKNVADNKNTTLIPFLLDGVAGNAQFVQEDGCLTEAKE
jgi:acyl-CoA thioesterase-1